MNDESLCAVPPMAVYDMIFMPARKDEDFIEDFEVTMSSFFTALSGKNRIIFETENICKQGAHYVARITAPFKDALEEKYDDKYVKKLREKFYSLLEKEPELEYVGEDICYTDCVCGGEEAQDYILCILPHLEDISPIRCGQCWSNIPYYLLPELSEETREELRNWKSVYFAYDKLFYATDIGEMGAHKMMSKVDSRLNKKGMEICRKLEKELGKPVYYYIYRFYGKHGKACPICGGEWKEPQGAITDYRCRKCRIVAHERS